MVGGALMVPTLVTCVWMSVFGGCALHQELQALSAYDQSVAAGTIMAESAFTGGPILQATQADTTSALFAMFEGLDPGLLGSLLSILAVLLLATYFITSADSGTLVLCILDSGGNTEPPKGIRVLWGFVIASIAGTLLYTGDLKTIQTASIVAGLPIAFFMLLMTFSLYRTLRREPLAAAMLPSHARPAASHLDLTSSLSETSAPSDSKVRSIPA